MSYSINPEDTSSKESWLAKRAVGLPTIGPPDWKKTRLFGNLPVCLVDNVINTVASIAYSEEEQRGLARDDGRSKIWYVIPISHLVRLHPELAQKLEG